jgi:hypothetical protein
MKNSSPNPKKEPEEVSSYGRYTPTTALWAAGNESGDLERLVPVLDHLPDEELMRRLEKERGKGRDDYPVRVVWSSVPL